MKNTIQQRIINEISKEKIKDKFVIGIVVFIPISS
jgi:hypothetical protein